MSDRPLVLVTDLYPPTTLALLQKQNHKHEIVNTSVDEIFNNEFANKKVEALLTRSQTRVNEALLKHLKDLRVVGTATSGFDHFDLDLLEKEKIIAFHTPLANADSTADLTLWHILSCLRHTGRQSKINWRLDLNRGHCPNDLNLGILGFGHIGQRVALRAKGFGWNVFYHDPYVLSDHRLDPQHFSFAETLGLLELFDHCDIISLHLPLTRKTKNIINEKTLAHFGSDKILINCARGDLIHTQDLLSALENGILSAVGLDVFATEPLPQDSRLRDHSKVVWTPHIGAYTIEAYEQSCLQAVNQLSQFLQSQKTPINPLPPQTLWAQDL